MVLSPKNRCTQRPFFGVLAKNGFFGVFCRISLKNPGLLSLITECAQISTRVGPDSIGSDSFCLLRAVCLRCRYYLIHYRSDARLFLSTFCAQRYSQHKKCGRNTVHHHRAARLFHAAANTAAAIFAKIAKIFVFTQIGKNFIFAIFTENYVSHETCNSRAPTRTLYKLLRTHVLNALSVRFRAIPRKSSIFFEIMQTAFLYVFTQNCVLHENTTCSCYTKLCDGFATRASPRAPRTVVRVPQQNVNGSRYAQHRTFCRGLVAHRT